MKNIFAFLFFSLLLLIASHSFSQAPNWVWGMAQNGGSSYTSSFGIEADKNNGDIFAGGRVSGGFASLGGLPAIGTGIWTARLNSSGVAKWVVTHTFTNSTSANYMYGFGKDDSDNTYAAGLLGSGSIGWYVDKYDSNGNQRWAVSISEPGGDVSPYGVSADKQGNAYVAGNFGGTKNFGNGVSISSLGSEDIFIAKYNNTGNCVWAKNFGGPGYDAARGIKIDNAGNILIIGNYSASATFEGITPPPVGGTIGTNFFIAKFDTACTPLWVATSTNAGITDGASYWNFAAMGVDSCGNVYASGHYIGTSQFGNLPAIISKGSRDIFIAKCLNDGNWEWVKSAGSSGSDEGAGFAFDKNNDVYLTGGISSGTATFGTQTISTTASGSLYIAKYTNSNGDIQWVQNIPGSVGTGGSNLAIDKWGYVYAIGGIENSTTTIGPSTVSGTASGGQNILIVKLDTTSALNITPHPDPSYCAGSTTSLPFDITGTFNGSNTFTAELSDSSGSFISADTLGSFKSISGGRINITIPGNVLPGTKYVIRIVSSNPATSSRYYCNSFSTSATQTTYETVTISNGASLKISGDTTVCSGTSVNLRVTGGSNYTWSPTTSLSCTTCSNPVASPTISSTYTVTVDAGSACQGSVSIFLNVLPGVNLITSPASDTTICGGNSAMLTVSGAATYAWSSSSSLNCTSCTTQRVTPTEDTTVYTITGTTANGKCSSAKQVTVYLGNNAKGGTIVSPRDTICQGTPGRLALTNFLGLPVQWQSSTDGNNFTDINTTDTANYKTQPLNQTMWFRAIIGSGTCTAISDTLKLFVPPTLLSKFNYIASNFSVTFDSDSSNGSIRSYSWNFGDNTTSTEANPVHTFQQDTTYYVCLTLYDGSNCSYTFCRYISSLTGINSMNTSANLFIYPNPVSEQLTLTGTTLTKDAFGVEMYDMLGRLVKNWNPSSLNDYPVVLNVSSLSKGMYYLKIKTEKTDFVQKIVKE